MELVARIWFERLPILIVRPFNYTGVGQKESFVVPKLVAAFKQRSPELQLGDTTVVREFMDVRDVAQIYAGLLESSAVSDLVNICSGKGYRLSEVIGRLETITGFRPLTKRSETYLRPNDIPTLIGSPEKLHRIVKRFSFRPLEETLEWMIDGSTHRSAAQEAAK